MKMKLQYQTDENKKYKREKTPYLWSQSSGITAVYDWKNWWNKLVEPGKKD